MVYANKQAPEKMARPVTQGIPQNWIIYSTNSQWSCIRLQRHASYSHSDTLQMRRQVVQAHTSGQELFVRQAEEQAGNNRNQLMASTFNIDIYKTIHQYK